MECKKQERQRIAKQRSTYKWWIRSQRESSFTHTATGADLAFGRETVSVEPDGAVLW